MNYMNMEKLGKYCKIISGYAFKSNDLSEGTEIPVIKIGNISNGNDVIIDSSTQYVSSDFLSIDEKYHIKKGDVLISLTGSHINQPNSMVGRSCRNFSDTEFLLNQRAGKVIPNENADKNYLYYLLNTESFKYSICNRAYGAANQANVSPSDIDNIKWNFPPLPTQQKIASILSAYDNLIQNYKKQIEALQTVASELYKEWFVRFRFPGWQNAKFENGIPEGWKVEKVKNCVNRLPFGQTYKKDELEPEGNVIVIDQSEDEYLGYHNNEPSHKASAENPIALFGDHSCKYKLMIKDFSLGENIIPYTSKGVDLYYLYYSVYKIVQTEEYKRHWNLFVNKKVLIPNTELQKSFRKKVIPIFKQIEMFYKQITNLTQQRDLLLPRLMSGKLEVK